MSTPTASTPVVTETGKKGLKKTKSKGDDGSGNVNEELEYEYTETVRRQDMSIRQIEQLKNAVHQDMKNTVFKNASKYREQYNILDNNIADFHTKLNLLNIGGHFKNKKYFANNTYE